MKVIASHNGLAATERALAELGRGRDTLSACLAGVAVVEDDPADDTVGYGGLPNAAGIVELDAAVMHGPTHRAGAVAALRNIRHPTAVARLVMEKTSRVILAGEGALAFARAHGFAEEDLLTDAAREKWRAWKRRLAGEAGPDDGAGEGPRDFQRPTGTVHVAALDDEGNLSCVTSTSGHAFKEPGRVGDSPIVGAGLYVDNEIGSCGSTGWGEANLENCSSFAAVELLRQGRTPEEAGLEALRRVVRHTPAQLQDDAGRPRFNLRLFLLTPAGDHAGVCLWGPQDLAVSDANGTRHEPCTPLFETPHPGQPRPAAP